jgi:hypothetical protein
LRLALNGGFFDLCGGLASKSNWLVVNGFFQFSFQRVRIKLAKIQYLNALYHFAAMPSSPSKYRSKIDAGR